MPSRGDLRPDYLAVGFNFKDLVAGDRVMDGQENSTALLILSIFAVDVV